jgi:hypothetical protein
MIWYDENGELDAIGGSASWLSTLGFRCALAESIELLIRDLDHVLYLTTGVVPEPDTKQPLIGPLNIGDELVWEPDKPHARAEVSVCEVPRERGHQFVALKDKSGRVYLNDESRVREACVRVLRRTL